VIRALKPHADAEAELWEAVLQAGDECARRGWQRDLVEFESDSGRPVSPLADRRLRPLGHISVANLLLGD
jgi:hypothetical protein